MYEIGHGEIMYKLEGIARYRVRHGGCLIEIDPETRADPGTVALFLLHPVFVLACIQRRDWLLSAAAVGVNGKAIALAGIAASGKSSLAACLAHHGYQVLADGLLRIERRGNGTLLAHPQAPWVMLWPELCEKVQSNDWCKGTQVRPGLELRRHFLSAESQPLPLARIGILRWQGRPDVGCFESQTPRGSRDVQRILLTTAGRNWLAVAGDRANHLMWAIDVASRCAIETLPLLWGWDSFDAVLNTVRNWAVGDERMTGTVA